MARRQLAAGASRACGLMNRFYPWRSWDEWLSLKGDLWSNDPHEREKALEKIHDWGLIHSIPMEMEVTASLVRAQSESRSPDVCHEVLEALYSVPIIRLTAAVRDNSDELMLRPGCEMPFSIGLARNDFVHGEKPTLEHLKVVCDQALDFVKTHYWDYLESCIPTEQDLIETVHEYFALHQNSNAVETDQIEGALEKLQSMADMNEVCTVLLDHIKPPAADESTWLLYLAELWLEKTIMHSSTTVHASHYDKTSDHSLWGDAIGSTLPIEARVVNTVERERIVLKIMDLMSNLAKTVHQNPELKQDIQTTASLVEKIFLWLTDQARQKQTKQRLHAVFQLLLKSLDPENSTASDPSANAPHGTTTTELPCGVFRRVEQWEACPIGKLPLSYTIDQ